MIPAWKKKFLKGGIEALDHPKGRPPCLIKRRTQRKKQDKQHKELTREQQLERENELLRLELAYLKKHRQRYHSISKKRSD